MLRFLVFQLFVGVVFSVQVDFRPYDVSALRIFQGSDYDQDGVFSRIELNQMFVKYDENDDGRVSRHEYTDYVTRETPSLLAFSHALYDDFDISGDHHLDKQDFDLYYAKLDSDDDGTVTQTEFVTYWVDLFTRTEHLHGNH